MKTSEIGNGTEPEEAVDGRLPYQRPSVVELFMDKTEGGDGPFVEGPQTAASNSAGGSGVT